MTLTNDPIEFEVVREMLPKEQQAAFDQVAKTFGNDTEKMVNGLMNITCLSAILGGVSAERFSLGMKVNWDHYADAINNATH